MANIVEYVKYYRNKDFMDVPFNEVDALVLSCLTYLNFDKFYNNKSLTIKELSVNYFSKVKPSNFKDQVNQGKLYRDCYNLFNTLKNTVRFKNIVISDYKKYVDNETQFGAMTFRINDFVFIAFEGTNTYISGWKEDCHLSHRFPVHSQELARDYINKNISLFDKTVYIGGHSKGGNLAVSGSMMANSLAKRRIKYIYDFDGPGLREKEFNSYDFKLIENKIRKYVPSQSMVGMLMYYSNIYKTVSTNTKVLLQHNPFSWQCFGSFYIEESLCKKSIKFSKDIKEFVKQYNEDSMEDFVEIIFKMFKDAKIEKTKSIGLSQIAKCTKYIKELKTDEVTKEKFHKLIFIIIDYINK